MQNYYSLVIYPKNISSVLPGVFLFKICWGLLYYNEDISLCT